MATAKKSSGAPTRSAPAKPAGLGASEVRKLVAEELSGIRDALRRLAKGQNVTEEHRDEILSLIDGKG